MYCRMMQSVARRFSKRLKDSATSKGKNIKDKYGVFRSKVSGFKAWISSESVWYNPYLKYYGAYLLVYGFILNYALHILQSFTLNIQTVLAWGITYYFVKEEFTEIIAKIARVIRGYE